MCRLVLFAGTCTRCNESLTWADLSQQLSCLEAKNADKFGSCRRGVDVETHAFDQECDACAGEDEGVAGMDFVSAIPTPVISSIYSRIVVIGVNTTTRLEQEGPGRRGGKEEEEGENVKAR
ncbi:hypothetical protein COL516b_010899 [Colletotrichum fioriniae]|nr:uncharacterized protein COL516b_010899 [Colletotrichum fioriniae]KAJ0297160.1 hypothetical protein COL516b_010899 [Colletotrichum fioriniae]